MLYTAGLGFAVFAKGDSMPYIKQEDRKPQSATNPGMLNYQITGLVSGYMNEKGLSYQTINDVLGALEGAKQEFYRRIAVPYENEKLSTNGDVYE